MLGRSLLSSLVLAAACASSSVGTGTDGPPGGGDGGTIDARGGGGTPDAPPGTEVCDGADNDGDQFVDEGGDELCSAPNAMTMCNGLGGCRIEACLPAFADVDGQYGNGCECAGEPTENGVATCDGAIDIGVFPDSNVLMNVQGNLAPIDDVDWYRFQAIDNFDNACDAFHVRVRTVNDADAEFQVEVWRGGCGGTQICAGSTDVQWFTNFQIAGSPPTGQCPCNPESAPSATVNTCTDDSSEFIVKVIRAPGKPLTCNNYTLEISNGTYPAP